jgi:hypothetical protein
MKRVKGKRRKEEQIVQRNKKNILNNIEGTPLTPELP